MFISKALRPLAPLPLRATMIRRNLATKRYYDGQSGLYVEISSDRQVIDSSLLQEWLDCRSKGVDMDIMNLKLLLPLKAALGGASSIGLCVLLPPLSPSVIKAIEELKLPQFDYIKGGIASTVSSTKEIDLVSKTQADAAHIQVDLIPDNTSKEGGMSLNGAAELVNYAKECSLGSWLTLNVNLAGDSGIAEQVTTIDTQLAILADLNPEKIILRVNETIDQESLRVIIENAFNLDIIGSLMSSRTFLSAPSATVAFADKELNVRNFCCSGEQTVAMLKMMIEDTAAKE